MAILEKMRSIAEKPGLTRALVGARNLQQAAENASAGIVELTAEEFDTLNQILSSQAAMAQKSARACRRTSIVPRISLSADL